MHSRHGHKMRAVVLVKIIHVGLMLEEVCVQLAGFNGGIGNDVILIFGYLQLVALLLHKRSGVFKYQLMRRGGRAYAHGFGIAALGTADERECQYKNKSQCKDAFHLSFLLKFYWNFYMMALMRLICLLFALVRMLDG